MLRVIDSPTETPVEDAPAPTEPAAGDAPTIEPGTHIRIIAGE